MSKLTKVTERPLTFDMDFRGEQYFIRIFYDYPNQNTPNNIKALKQEFIQAIRLLDLVKNTTIDMTERERSLLNLLLKESSETLGNSG